MIIDDYFLNSTHPKVKHFFKWSTFLYFLGIFAQLSSVLYNDIYRQLLKL